MDKRKRENEKYSLVPSLVTGKARVTKERDGRKKVGFLSGAVAMKANSMLMTVEIICPARLQPPPHPSPSLPGPSLDNVNNDFD